MEPSGEGLEAVRHPAGLEVPDLGISEMWLELRSELEGLWWVPLVGLLDPVATIALRGILSFLFPLPLFLASLRASRSDRSGPAIALGALLGYLVPVIFGLSPLYPPYYRLMHRGAPAPRVERIPLPCRACSPPLTTLLVLLEASVAIPPALPFVMTCLIMCAYPAYVAFKRFRTVPRLLLIAYAGALLASSALWILCFIFHLLSSFPDGGIFGYFLMLLDLAASLPLASACLRRARRGGGEKILSFLTFYALVGTFWLGGYAFWWGWEG